MATEDTATTAGRDPVAAARVVWWLVLVGALAALSYIGNAAGGDIPDDVLYRWPTAVAAVVQYAVILVLVLFLCRGIDRSGLGLRRPRSWPRAVGLVVVAFLVVAVTAALLNLVLKAGEEQGLVPDAWDPDRAPQFVANFVVVALVAPIVEELLYRGAGLAVTTARWGLWVGVGVTALAFGLAHGLVVALPVLTFFGLVLAVVRVRTDSLYPPMLLHGIFNGMALLAAVTLEVGS